MKRFHTILAIFSALYATTYNVPSTQYPTIQSALSIAQDGDIVFVASGTPANPITYTENLLIETGVILLSADGAGSTIIDGSNPADNMGSTITIRPASGSATFPQGIEISGFTITGGIGNSMNRNTPNGIVTGKFGGGIMVYNTAPKIKNNLIKNNGSPQTNNGGGIIALDGAEDWSFNDREWVYNLELEPVTEDLDFSDNTFYANEAILAKSVFVDGFEQLSTNLSNSTFDCFSSDYQDVSEYWVEGELTEFNYEGSQGIESIYTDVWVDPVDGVDQGNYIGDIEHPFRTINFAFGMIYATEENPITIHLNEGEFSPSNNNEIFPIFMRSNINLIGQGEDYTTLNADSTSRVMEFYNTSNNRISGVLLTGGEQVYESGWLGSSGGGIASNFASFIIDNVTISENSGWSGGGISIGECIGDVKLIKVNIINNSANFRGGGILIDRCDVILADVVIDDNSSSQGDGGAGIDVSNSNPILRNVLISNNAAPTTQSSLTAGMHLSFSNPKLINVTISQNTSGGKGGLLLYHSDPEIMNSIIYYNQPDNISSHLSGSDPIITYSNIGECGNNWCQEVNGNIDINTQFTIDFEPLAYQCLNSGNPDFWFNDIDESRNDMGYTGGPFLHPNFTHYDFGEVGSTQNNTYFELLNYRNVPITIDGVDFSSSSFSAGTSFPITINPNQTGKIQINCHPVLIGDIIDDMFINSSELIENLSVELSAIGTTGNLLSGNLSNNLPPGTYQVIDDIQVVQGDTLNLQSGTKLLFDHDVEFIIYGVLKAIGTEADSIIFDIENFQFYNDNPSANWINEAWHGITMFNQSEETIMDFVRISRSAKMDGAAIYMYNSNPVLQNMEISNNNSLAYPLNPDTWGGGSIHLSNSNPILSNIDIVKNYGGIYIEDSTPNLTNILISQNISGGFGGIYLQNSDPIISNSIIKFNESTNGRGGGICMLSSSPIISDVIISSNETGADYQCMGGGIYAQNSYPGPSISNTTITRNTSGRGGGISLFYSSAEITNTTISENTSEYGGGGIDLLSSSDGDASIYGDRLIIVKNSSGLGNWPNNGSGGGINLEGYSNIDLQNSIIIDNRCGENYSGAGIYAWWSAQVNLTNSIVFFNRNEGNIEDISFNLSGNGEYPGAYNEYHIEFSDIEGDNLGWISTDEGFITLDPKFIDFENGDYTLSWDNYPVDDETKSPCIDTGTADIDGDGIDDISEALYVDGNGDGISIPDMGAFEYIPEQQNSSGDLNGDGTITVNDIIMLVDIIIYYNGIGDSAGDLNGDGAITVNDIIIVVDIILYN